MRQMFFLDEIAEAVGGRVINTTGADNAQISVSGVSKDTRTINEGDLYIAIVGENFDGHKFCAMACEKGASVLLVSDETQLPEKCAAVVVDDTVKAMGRLARHYRFKLNAKVICVTGSVGKTTTREMIACGLRSSRRVCSTKANLNNEIGLPMTILEAPEDTEVLILEMGMRLRGEISYLTNIACPDIAVITNAGYCHIERLGSREEIRLAKMEIIEGLTEGGTLIISSDDDFLFDYARQTLPDSFNLIAVSAKGILSFGTSGFGCVNARNIDLNKGVAFDIEENLAGEVNSYKGVSLALNGAHYVTTAMFVYACSMLAGVNPDASMKALGEYKEMKGRGEVTKCEDYTIINDAYNAGPESMMASYFNLSVMGSDSQNKPRKIAVLGGMLELGEYAPILHEMIGQDCGKYGFDYVIVEGDNSSDFVKGLLQSDPDAKYRVCVNNEEVEAELHGYIQKGDVILFKASNAFGFEKMALNMIRESRIIND